MDKPIDNYWRIRLANVKKKLDENNFEAYIAENSSDARKIVLNEILPKTTAKSISWGGSQTFIATGLYDHMKNNTALEILDTYDKSVPKEEIAERRRQALLADLFITGSNAVTESGALVNLDAIGNRVGALAFGPEHVVVLAGRNKIVPDVEAAMRRIKHYTAPINAMRLDKKTPCVKTGCCEACKVPECICNVWTITEKSMPKGRIKIVLINEDLGI